MVLASLQCWGLLLQLGCTFTSSLSKALFVVPSLKFFAWPLQSWPFSVIEVAPSPVLLASYRAKPQLLSVTPAFLQNQFQLGDFFITKFGCQHEVQPWVFLKQLICAPPEDSSRFYLSGAGFFSIIANFLAPDNSEISPARPLTFVFPQYCHLPSTYRRSH